MPPFKDITGQRFGRLTAIKVVGRNSHGQILWECKCDCGAIRNVVTRNLVSGGSKSCGCLQKEKARASMTFLHEAGIAKPPKKTTHGESKTCLYKRWVAMKQRCENVKDNNYPYYGMKGIKVCEEWRNSYLSFREWSMKNGYVEGLTIDRIDPRGDYTPSNCRWVTNKEQANNKTTNHFVTINGETHTISQWAEKVGKDYFLITNRIYNGWDEEKAIMEPKKRIYAKDRANDDKEDER